MAEPDRYDRALDGRLMRYEVSYPQDEISLVDLWIILVRHKWLILTILVLSVALGTTYAIMSSPNYKYTTSLQIAKIESGPIESPATVVAKLENSYIPRALLQSEAVNGLTDSIDFNVSVPKDSLVVVLESTGPVSKEKQHAQLHGVIFDQVLQDHRQELEDRRQSLVAELGQLRVQLNSNEEEAEVLEDQEARLDDQEKLLRRQLGSIQDLAGNAEEVRSKLLAQQNGNTGAVELMLINSEISKLRESQTSLNEELIAGLNAQRNELQSRILENSRQKMELNERISEIDVRLENFPSTRITTSTMQSQRPVGIGDRTILMLSVILGLMLGVFTAFFAEFFQHAREKMQARDAA